MLYCKLYMKVEYACSQHFSTYRLTFPSGWWELGILSEHSGNLSAGQNDHIFQLGGLLLWKGPVGPFLLQAAFCGPPPVAAVEDQGNNIPGYEHIHCVMLSGGYYQRWQNSSRSPYNSLSWKTYPELLSVTVPIDHTPLLECGIALCET